MGVYIKDMKTPTTCAECRYFIKGTNHISLDYKYYCINGASALVFPSVYEYRAFDCPLIDVPEPHGRLIDADEIKYYGVHIGDEYEDKFHDYQRVDRSDIDNAPTVIEGSK